MNKGKRRDKISRKTVRKIIIAVVIVLAAVAVAAIVLRGKVDSSFNDGTVPVSAQVTKGNISMTVTGSGTLENEDSEDVDIPEDIEIEEIVVETGEKVDEGALLATVNTASVISAMSDLQEEIDALDETLDAAADDTVSSKISAQISGRVKEIYAQKGDDVASIMYEKDALMLLSLDGHMAVDIASDALETGDEVTVSLTDGTEYKGSTEQVKDGTATILIPDDGPENGASVSVTKDSTSLGSGTLYIHNALKVTGYAGTVSEVHAKENQTVKAGATLLTLKDTSYTANYDSILKERAELEEDMQRLITIYKEGAVYAPFAGIVEEITEADEDTDTDTAITLCPGETMTVTASIDESEILSLSVGQEATVTVDSIENEEFTGTVTEIDTTGTSSGGVTKYTAVVTIDKTDRMLAGMSASISVTTEGVEDALLIPEDALNQTSSTAYVYTSYDESAGELGGMVEITYGISNGTYLQVLSGLKEGDTVYYYEESNNMMADIMSMRSEMLNNMTGGQGASFGGGNPGGGDFQGGMPDMGGGRRGGNND